MQIIPGRESREFFYPASDDLAIETFSDQRWHRSWFKIDFKGGGKRVSGLLSNREEPINNDDQAGGQRGQDVRDSVQ